MPRQFKKKSFLNFQRLNINAKAKTDFWQVFSVTGIVLGHVKWFPPFRRYCFFPQAHCLFDANCLQEIKEFLEEKMLEHKKNLAIKKG